MAKIFHQQDKLDTAYSLYSTLTSIWHDYLVKLVKQRISDPTPATGLGPAKKLNPVVSSTDVLDETQGAEAVQILHAILNVYESESSSEETLGKLYFTLAMLYTVLSQKQSALDYHAKSAEYLAKNKVEANYDVLDLSKFKETVDGLA